MVQSHDSLTLSSFLLAGQVMRKRGSGGHTPPSVVPEISAVVPPAEQPLFDGQTVGQITDIATWRDTGNYSSNVGTISSVMVLVDGTARDDSWVLSEGEAVVVRVTDSQATTRDWTIDNSVDYLARLTDKGDGTYALETNGLAPTGLVVPTLTATLDGIDYTYSGHTIADLTGGPTFADGYPVISHGGAGADPVAGDTTTVDPGYLVYAGTLTGPGYQWRRDGADISGATGASYTVQAADEGTAITCAVTASDANASRTEVTPALSVPVAPPSVVPEISAVVPPAEQPLFDGQTVGQITDIATWRDTGNYSSNVGTISSVMVLVDGTARDDSWMLSEGEAVVVRVTDSQATTRDWTIDNSVDYLARLTDKGDGTYALETNGLAPTGLVVPTLTATLDGIDYTYSGHTIADLTGGPTFADGYPVISHGGAGADPVAGDTTTVDPGYLVYAGTLTGPGYQWRRDGADISGATGASYTVQAADEGTAITCAVTASDANASRTEVTPALSVPSTVIATIPAFVGNHVEVAGGSDITLAYPAVQAGDLAIIAVLNRLGSLPTITGYTQVGVTAETGTQASDARMSIFARTLDGSETTQGISGGNRLAAALYVYRPAGSGSLSVEIKGANAGSGGPISISGGTLTGNAGRVLIAIGDRDDVAANIGSIANASLSDLGKMVEAAYPTSPNAGSIECADGIHAGGTLSATSASQAAAEKWAAINVEIWEA